jgi:signal transduction histidine kinase
VRLLPSLRSRVFAAMAIVTVLPIAVALVFVTRRVTQQAETELLRRLAEAARLVEQYHRTRRELAAERASLVADLPKLKAAVATADPPTVEPLARDYRERVRSDVLVVLGRDGDTLAAVGAQAPAWRGSVREEYRVDRGRLLETVSAPILIGAEEPEVLGHLTLAFALDDAFASRLAALSGGQVAVVQGGRVFASTFSHSQDRSLAGVAGERGVRTVALGGEPYSAQSVALGEEEDAPIVLVLRSRAEALRPLRTLRGALAVAALVAVVASLLLSWALARSVTRPLAALTDAMKEIAATGDLARPIGPGRPWDDEDARLVARTFGTLTASIARFQREGALRDRLSALGRLSTVIAHEVRNPLMIIKGSVRSLRRFGSTPAEVREAAADIDHEVARLDRVVGDVLDFARPLEVSPGPVELPALVREAAHASLRDEEGVGVRFAFDPGVGQVTTDGERLRAVVVNLVANARDSVLLRRASGGDGPSAGLEGEPIEVGTRTLGGGRVLVYVEDRGTGVPARDLPHVFEPYFTTKRTGTGLGLAIARKVVEALGGIIRLESREGEATRVEVELPEVFTAGALGRKNPGRVPGTKEAP